MTTSTPPNCGSSSLWTPFYLILLFGLLASQGFTQTGCPEFPAYPADADCEGITELTDNMSVEAGDTRALCGTDTTNFAIQNINLNGGTIRVCADATISGTFNSGTLIVACGATVNFPSGLTMNNDVHLVNYGTVEVNGNMNFQNTHNAFYNASPTARLMVSGNLIFGQNANQTGYFLNQGYAEIGGNILALEGGRFCLGDSSVLTFSGLIYQQNCGSSGNRFNYDGTGDPAILRVANSAILRADLTLFSQVQFWRATGATLSFPGSCGSLGSATTVTNAPAIARPDAPNPILCNPQNCYTRVLLPVELIDFRAIPQATAIALRWTSATETNLAHYTLERSQDLHQWEALTDIPGTGNSTEPKSYQFSDQHPVAGICYYRLKSTDLDGSFHHSDIRSVKWTENAPPQIHLFPNPATQNVQLEGSADLKAVRIFTTTGQEIPLPQFDQPEPTLINLDLATLAPGIYFIHTNLGTARLVKMN